MLTIPNTGSVSRVSEESVNKKRIYASVPYIKGSSELLQRAFKSHNVTIVHKPLNSLRSQLVHDKTDNRNWMKQKTLKNVEKSITSIANNVTKIMWAKLLGY